MICASKELTRLDKELAAFVGTAVNEAASVIVGRPANEDTSPLKLEKILPTPALSVGTGTSLAALVTPSTPLSTLLAMELRIEDAIEAAPSVGTDVAVMGDEGTRVDSCDTILSATLDGMAELLAKELTAEAI